LRAARSPSLLAVAARAYQPVLLHIFMYGYRCQDQEQRSHITVDHARFPASLCMRKRKQRRILGKKRKVHTKARCFCPSQPLNKTIAWVRPVQKLLFFARRPFLFSLLSSLRRLFDCALLGPSSRGGKKQDPVPASGNYSLRPIKSVARETCL
jgi:hypothetical protein